jgi:hypothetical protein
MKKIILLGILTVGLFANADLKCLQFTKQVQEVSTLAEKAIGYISSGAITPKDGVRVFKEIGEIINLKNAKDNCPGLKENDLFFKEIKSTEKDINIVIEKLKILQ